MEVPTKIDILSEVVVRPPFPFGKILKTCLKKGARNYEEVYEAASPTQGPGGTNQERLDAMVREVFSVEEIVAADNIATVWGPESAVPEDSVAVCPVVVSDDLLEASSIIDGHVLQLREDAVEQLMEADAVQQLIAAEAVGSPQQSSSSPPRPLTPRSQFSQASIDLPSVGPSPPDVDDLLNLTQDRPLSPILSGNRKRAMKRGGKGAKKLARTSPSGSLSVSSEPSQSSIWSQSTEKAHVEYMAGLFSKTVQQHGEWEQKAQDSGREVTKMDEKLELAKTQRQTDLNLREEMLRKYHDLQRKLRVLTNKCNQNVKIVESLQNSKDEVVQANNINETQLQKYARKLADLRKIGS